ncbi:MAG: PQQ-binding-like beta-propeller repeat protein [Pseudomonadota bacterium]
MLLRKRLLLLYAGILLALSSGAHAADCERTSVSSLESAYASWGGDHRNHRNFREAASDIDAGVLTRLAPRWVFALPDTDAPRAVPAVTADTVFIADGDGGVYALSRSDGCEKWRFDAGSMVRTALSLVDSGAGPRLVFGTLEGELVALLPATGEEAWRLDVRDHPRAMISGSAVAWEGVIYQGVSSYELFWAANPFYSCCNFRGSLVAVDAATGEQRWRSHTIVEEPAVTASPLLLPDKRGPSGAPIWSQPTIDAKRGRVYVGTGQNYSEPASSTSNAIIAFDLESGEMLWHQQFLAGDIWNVGCAIPGHPSCPEEEGPDLDFGAPPILATADGNDILLAGQKSGEVFALDPDREGALLWRSSPGGGGKAGGIHFGMAVDPERGLVFVPISDRDVGFLGASGLGSPRPSLHAIDIASGETRWVIDSPASCIDADGDEIDGCYPGFSAPASVVGKWVFAPTLDGVIRAFDLDSGEQVWSYDTRRRFNAVNGDEAEGGAIDQGGVYAAGDELYVNSGYGLVNQIPGNAFIQFAPSDEQTATVVD